MSEHRLDNNPLSPVEQLANVYDSLADDAFDAPADIDEETNQRASRIARDAIDKALSSGGGSDAVRKDASQSPPAPKTNMRSESDSGMASTESRKPGWFARCFGLHPATALVLTIIALVFDVFVWGSMGLGTILEIPLAAAVGLLTWQLQTRLYGDEGLTVVFKIVAACVLTALPIPLAPLVFIPAGIIGMVWGKARGKANAIVTASAANEHPHTQAFINLTRFRTGSKASSSTQSPGKQPPNKSSSSVDPPPS